MRKKKRSLIIFGLVVLSIIFAGLYKHHLQIQKEQVAKKKTIIDLGFGPKLTRALSNWELLSDNEVVFVKKDIYKKGYSYIFKGTIRNIGKKPQKKVYVVWAFLDPIGKDFMEPIKVATEFKKGGDVFVKKIAPLFIDTIDYLDKGAEADFHISVYSYPNVSGSLSSASFNDIVRAAKNGEYYVGIYKEVSTNR